MTIRARMFTLFPAVWLLAVVASVAWWIGSVASVPRLLLVLAALYLLPVACFRVHQLLWPLAEGRTRLDTPEYVPWWGAHQCQLMYTAFPALEAALS